MKVFSTVAGGYPRIGASAEKQKLRTAIAKLDLGKISLKELQKVEDEVTKEVIEEQTEAGIDIPSDGQIRWYDNVSHMLRNVAKINGLVRFYDTNYLYRQPIINKKLERKSPILVDEFKFAKGCLQKPVKMVLTGPYTLAMLSANEYYKSQEQLIDELTDLVAQEVKDLSDAGCKHIQLDEPEILGRPNDFSLLEKAIKKVAAQKGKSVLYLYTYFGDATLLYSKLQGLPVDVLGFDLTYSEKLWNKLVSSDKDVALGIVDARNTKREDVKKTVKRIKLDSKIKNLYINPSASLEYLPRDVAYEKLKLVREIAQSLSK